MDNFGAQAVDNSPDSPNLVDNSRDEIRAMRHLAASSGSVRFDAPVRLDGPRSLPRSGRREPSRSKRDPASSLSETLLLRAYGLDPDELR